jgi:GNAT superfamily N-acetyltransferase
VKQDLSEPDAGRCAVELTARRLADLPPEEADRFFAWIETLTPELDNEDSEGFAFWLRAHAATAGDDTFVYSEPESGALVGTASLVARDRGLAAEAGGVVVAGVNVVRERRGRGFGDGIMAHLLQEVRSRAEVEARSITVTLRANYPPAIRLYSKHGFRLMEGSTDTLLLECRPT